MSIKEYDYFVIGAGSAGVRSARIASSLGAKVGIAEAKSLGGTCVNLGCVPKKIFAYAADKHAEFEDAKSYGWDVTLPQFNWKTLKENKDKEIARLNSIYGNILKNNNVDLYEGFARFIDANTLEINGETVKAKKIAIATGGRPRIVPFDGHEHAIVSDDAFHLDALPSSIVIYGGGYVAVEFAHIYHGLGLDVTLVYRGDLFLRSFDREISQFLADEMRKQGIKLLFDTEIAQIEKKTESYSVTLSNGDTLETGLVFSALGRVPEIDKLNIDLEHTENGYIKVNENFETSIPNIYAVGDIIGEEELTPVAIRHGHHLAEHLFNKDPKSHTNFDLVATAIFSRPEIGTCGLSEDQAIEKHKNVDVYTSTFRPLAYTLPDRQEKTLMKLVVDRKSDKVVGLHLAGLHAAEMLQGFGVALQMGATKKDFDKTVAIHPTSAEEFVTMKEPTRRHGSD